MRLFVCVGLATLALACSTMGQVQEPKALAPELVKDLVGLRSGDFKPEVLLRSVEGLLAHGYTIAAEWWVKEGIRTLANKRRSSKFLIEGKRLLKAVHAARRAAGENHDLALELVRHMRALVQRRHYSEAEHLHPFVLQMVTLVPGGKAGSSYVSTKRLLKRSLERGNENEDVPRKINLRTVSLEDSVRISLEMYLARALLEFKLGGASFAQRSVCEIIRTIHGSLEKDEPRKQVILVRKRARDLGPVSKLEFWLLGDPVAMDVARDTQAVSVDGRGSRVPLSGLRKHVVTVIPGDLILFHPVKGREETATRWMQRAWLNSVLAVHARLDGKDLPKTAWRALNREHRRRLEPTLHKVSYGWKSKRDSGPLGSLDLWFKLHEKGGTFRYPWNGFYEGREKLFNDLRVPFTWIVAFTKQASYALKIPDRPGL